MKSVDVLAIVEAAYRLEGTDGQWLAGIAEVCRAALDDGFGVCVFQFEHRMGEPPEVVRHSMLGIPDELSRIYESVFRGMAPDVQQRPFIYGPCTTGSEMMRQRADFIRNEHMQRHVHRFGMYDSVWITAAEPSGSGCGIHAGRSAVAWASRPFKQRWGRIASHLAAALRIRRRLQSVGESPAVEAVLSPQGELLHAEGPAKQPHAIARLRRAVLDLEEVRGQQRHSARATSLSRWQSLIDARWSLLDQFDHDGRRFVVARENAPRPPGPRALTERERQVIAYAALGHDNKVIAYDLGIAHATVKVLMARAASKLGVKSRPDAIAAYLGACGRAAAHERGAEALQRE
ncbi:MAG TPA: helix-turn-helix transcriptional regulator [Polyangiaceae bacterium]|nr:helix-turn-helix transcriptional regulator [Polyangiaceae bacterium]